MWNPPEAHHGPSTGSLSSSAFMPGGLLSPGHWVKGTALLFFKEMLTPHSTSCTKPVLQVILSGTGERGKNKQQLIHLPPRLPCASHIPLSRETESPALASCG